ncbi:diguanylate cyclase [Sinorhizobium americanum]|uniref:diguanylate cyclase n=1 Tax=Sinorhizobium americanum TaxID=194963 RepID=A0A1L3LR05_9HYPH|nr:diguanylate cyclase [Sinorhizobium americanum]APG92497.1 response regulator/GGDEF domain transcriptional regulator [Sinorhizobium americanum]OAP35367.1 histidine kinase [Sinorhizobium americanum]
MNGIWGQFVGNLAFVSLAISLWAQLSIWLRRRFVGHEKLLFGLVAGVASIGSILLAVEFGPGIHMDLRFAPLALAGMFGGPIAAALSASLAILFRAAIGGVSTIDGVVAIIVVTGMGVSVNLLMKKRSPTLPHVVILGAAVGTLLIVLMAVLPTLSKVHALAALGLPMAAMNCAATIVCGFIVLTTQHLELERRMLETAFSQSPDYLYVKDRDSRFVTVNENMIRLYRMRTTAEMVGLSDFDLHPRPLAEELYHREQEAMRTGVPLIDSLEHIEGRDLLASKVPLRDKAGRVIGLAGVTRDITERTALERELRESKNLLSHAMAGMSDGFAMFNRDGYLLFCNDQYRNAFPLSGSARVIGAHISDIVRCVAETRERLNVPYESVDEWINEATSTLHRNKDEEVQHQNGDWHSIRTRLAPDGTAMVVVSDITVMKQAEMALRLSAEQLKNLAETDGLTGIVNRRAFDEAFVREAAKCARSNTPLSLLMIDIDRFKAYNDTYGHPAGDQCLRLVSKCLLNSAQRPTDIVARYGGEEFVVLLPDTDDKAAAIVAEKFARLLGEEKILHAQSEFGSVTASIGIASALGHVLQAEPNCLLSEADAALYEAKMLGRNRILSRVLADAADIKLAG